MRRTVVAVTSAAILAGVVTAADAQRRPTTEGSSSTWPLQARLLGSNEIDQQTGRRNAGDRDARGHASVSGKSTKICVALAYKDLGDIAAAHIHRGKSNQNGPVVITLAKPEDGALGASSSCHTVEASLSRAIVRNPQNYYVNIHTSQFPGGAIRGQLRRG